MVRDGVVEAEPEAPRGFLDLQPAPWGHRQPFALLLRAVGDEEAREDPAVRGGLLDVDPDPAELGRKDAGLDLLGHGEGGQAQPHGGEEPVAAWHGLEHQDEGDGEADEGEEPDGLVEPDRVDAGGPQGDQLRVCAHPAERDEEAEEERDGERQDDDVRE